jgi:small subunit ribosomal protein S7
MENKILLFNKWDTSDITVQDPGLKNFISLKPILVPKTGGKNIKIKFHKSKNHIVERLITKLMVVGHKGKKHKLTSGRNCGKGVKVYNLVIKAFNIIESKLNLNPVKVFVKAVENSAPREEITSIEYGGARYPQSVDCAPQRRIDIALRMMTQGAYHKSFRNKKGAEECLAEEIILAYNNDNKSIAVAKKLELERQAEASR